MRKFLIDCAKNLTDNTNILQTYKKLADFYHKENYVTGYASCLEKIWHLNKEPNLLLELSRFSDKNLNDAHLTCLFRAMYFYNYSPMVFVDFLHSINLNNDFVDEIIQESKTNDVILLVHRHFICCFMIIFAHERNDLALVSDLLVYLKKIIAQVEEVKKQGQFDSSDLNSYEKDKCILSSTLSKTEHHNDINHFAISLNKDNETAYFNIIEDLLVYKNYDAALSFYNNDYALAFDKPKFSKPYELCWHMNLINSQQYNFYKSLLFQKFAIELELNENSCGG